MVISKASEDVVHVRDVNVVIMCLVELISQGRCGEIACWYKARATRGEVNVAPVSTQVSVVPMGHHNLAFCHHHTRSGNASSLVMIVPLFCENPDKTMIDRYRTSIRILP